MTKRTMWYVCCIVFAAMWTFLGMFFFPFLFFAFVSLMMIMVPVGVSEKPSQMHNPNKWSNGGNQSG